MKRILPLLLILLLLLAGCQKTKSTSKRNKDDSSKGNILSGWLDNRDEEEETSIETTGLVDRPQVTTTAPTEPVEDTSEWVTTAGVSYTRQEALELAWDYLKYLDFSYEGLIDQLEYEGYSLEDATYAVDNCGADWYAEAAECAASYLEYSSFSRADLIDQLEYEGFTYEQAVYGVDAVYEQSSSGSGVSASKENALKSAESYLKYSAFSYEGLIDQLEYEGYSKEDATYAVDNCGADWYAEAAECAASYLEYMSFTRADLIDQLEYEGFTYDQSVYAVTQNGL